MLKMNSLAGLSSVLAAAAGGWQPVTWTDIVNITESPTGTLTKTGGVDSTWDAGAFANEGHAGDFELRMTHDSAWGLYWFGVSVTNSGDDGATIDYSIAYVTGNWRIYENNTYRGDFGTVGDGDVIEIRRSGTTITYYINDTLKHTSAVSSTGTLKADVSLYANSGTVSVVAGVEFNE